MNIIDRIIEFNDWPTDRKAALLMFAAFVFHVLISIPTYYFGIASGIIDENLYFIGVHTGTLVTGILFVSSLISTSFRGDGRWTAYSIILVYGGWVGYMALLEGFWTTGFIAWIPAVVILVNMWFDERIGLSALAFVVVLTISSYYLVTYDIVPKAPLFTDRTLDAQFNGAWAISLLLPIFAVTVFAFGMASLSVVVRKRQSRKLVKAQVLIRRYTPSQVADRILSDDMEEELKPQRKKLTLFFSDVEGFTTASDHLEPEELANVLNQYLSEMAEIAQSYGATIDQFMGDGIMLFFGAPEVTDDKDHAMRAVKMAVEMQKRILNLNDVWLQHGIRTPLRARMGINTGYASVGDFGSKERKSYTAIGIQANIAARIQTECEPGKVLITDATWALVKDAFDCSNKGELKLKGVHFPVKVYEVIGEKGATKESASTSRVVPLKAY